MARKPEQTDEQQATAEEIAEAVAALRRWVEHATSAAERPLVRMEATALAVRLARGFGDDVRADSSSDRPAERGEPLLRWRTAEILVSVAAAHGATRPADAAMWTYRARSLDEELRQDLLREKGRDAQRIKKDKQTRVVILEAQKVLDAHPDWGLQAVAPSPA